SFFALYHFCIFVLTFVAPTELEAAEEEGVDPEFLDSVEAGFEQAAETLVTMRKARTRLAEVRKDCGYGRAQDPGGRKPPATAEKASGKHPCFDCGQSGHWAGILNALDLVLAP
ncbi:unnamed protein product, partial [Effrenium voratum]